MGETRPGDKIRRGSINKADLELCGEQGTGLVLRCCGGWVLACMWLRDEIERTSGLAGGTAKEQHHDRRLERGPVPEYVGLRCCSESPIVIMRERERESEVLWCFCFAINFDEFFRSL